MPSDVPAVAADYAAVGVVLAASGLALVPLASSVLRAFVDERARFFARWGFSHVLGVFFAALVAMLLAPFLLGAVGLDAGEDALALVLASLLITGAAAAAAARVAVKLSPEGLGALGVPQHPEFPAGRALVGAVLAYLIVLPTVVGLERISPWLFEVLGAGAEPVGLVERLVQLEGARLAVALFLCILVGPFFEEVVFRGFLQPLFVQNFSEKGGIAVSAALFAILHGRHAFLPLFALAILLGYLMLRTQRLLAPFLVHALHNGLVLFLALRYPELLEIVR